VEEVRYFDVLLFEEGREFLCAFLLEAAGVLVVAAAVRPEELVVLVLAEVVVEVGVDGVEHLVYHAFLEVGPQPENGPHELLLAYLAFVAVVGHAEDVSEDQAHILGLFVELVDGVQHGVGGLLGLDLGDLVDVGLLLLFVLLVAEGLVDLFLLLEVVLQQLDAVPVLLDPLGRVPDHALHLNYNLCRPNKH
jgi:hypothetical protein